MNKFMYITDRIHGAVLINTDSVEYVERDSRIIKMASGRLFVVKPSELDEILTELETIRR